MAQVGNDEEAEFGSVRGFQGGEQDGWTQTIGFESTVQLNKEGKYYYKADVIQENMIQKVDEVDRLYAEDKYPTLLQLVSSVEQEGYELYTPSLEDDASDIEDKEGKLVIDREGNVQKNFFNRGDWIEYLGVDMKWKIAQVSSVVKQAPDDWDYDDHNGKDPPPEDMNIYYNIGDEKDGLIPEDEVRAPEQGIMALFGSRPWLWQQHCLLQLERRLRFQSNHEYDFAEVDCQRFAKNRFQAWLTAPGNEDFNLHYEDQTVIAQKLLETHLLTPFEVMDRIVEDTDNWDFTDSNITVYTYYGVLGSGLAMVLVTFAIQFLSFLVLFFNQFLEIDGDSNLRFEVISREIGNSSRLDFFPEAAPFASFLGLENIFAIPHTSAERFCPQTGRTYGKILLFVMILLYCVKVLPDTLYIWFRVSGGDPSTSSKINSLRSIIWDKDHDSIAQQVGFKIDRFMNTGFICLLFMAMLLILLATDNLIDIILNALAIEFIHQVDEKLADSEWWDRDGRWIQAGTVELLLLSELKLNTFKDASLICKRYDIDPDAYSEALGGMKTLRDPVLAKKDDQNIEFMTKKEILWKRFAEYAIENGRTRAINQFVKKPKYFGIFETLLSQLGIRLSPMFGRHTEYRVWSRWEKILFLPKVPFIIDKSKLEERKALTEHKQTIDVCSLSFKRTDFNLFVLHILSVLTLAAAADSMRNLVVNKRISPILILWRIFESALQIFSYLCVIIFPFYLVIALFAFPICY